MRSHMFPTEERSPEVTCPLKRNEAWTHCTSSCNHKVTGKKQELPSERLPTNISFIEDKTPIETKCFNIKNIGYSQDVQPKKMTSVHLQYDSHRIKEILSPCPLSSFLKNINTHLLHRSQLKGPINKISSESTIFCSWYSFSSFSTKETDQLIGKNQNISDCENPDAPLYKRTNTTDFEEFSRNIKDLLEIRRKENTKSKKSGFVC